MKHKQSKKWTPLRKILVVVLGIVVIVSLIVVPMLKKNSTPTSPEPTITIEGTFDCLPHKDPSKPHTMECALGIKTDSSVYYALKFEKNPSLVSSVVTGQRAKVSGILDRQESIYKSEGSINVSSLIKQ